MQTSLRRSFKFENTETPTRTGTVSVNCSVYCRSNDDRTRKYSDLGEISAVTMRLLVGLLPTDCLICIFSHL